ncbi:helix-turn-helix transcriptional regulator [Ectopseudomonas oleovorans]|uniref:Transcriptional regulator n=1 Tax=Ectopseudomonas oleovorans TaxID=301 RepID=A0A427H7U3_ECTOL|nr:transcriptional regulator [Pseudomonas oleovorans]RRW26499.1 transcriptional regulator [Pseudomonas oleovorans]
MTPHTAAPSKALIRRKGLCDWLDLSSATFDRLRKNDPSFPKPIKNGDARQAGVHFVVSEVEAWLEAKIAGRDAA